MNLKQCPCCKRKLLLGGLKNHIIGTARQECWKKCYNSLRKTPHLNFYWKHCKVIKLKGHRKETLSFIRIR